jgi:PAT family beta-lactamase induction signal transducer AmpG
MTLPGKFMSGFSGLVVDSQGYFIFFSVAALLGIPAIILVLVIQHHYSVERNSTVTQD